MKGYRKRAALLAALVTIGAAAAYTTATASAVPPAPPAPPGHTILANFCLADAPFCMSAQLGRTKVEGYGVSGNAGQCSKTEDSSVPAGAEYCVPSETGFLRLRPGRYSITAVDGESKHNFSLRSCPRSSLPCTDSNPDMASEQDITGITEIETVTVKVDLKPGWYRLLCDAGVANGLPVVHEKAGMFIDLEVGP
jgi:hypothetical protein